MNDSPSTQGHSVTKDSVNQGGDKRHIDKVLLGASDNLNLYKSRLKSAESLLPANIRQLISGSYHRISFSSMFMVGIWDAEFQSDCLLEARLQNHLCFEFIIEGGYDRLYGTQTITNINSAGLYLSKFGDSQFQQRIFSKGNKLRAICLWLDLDTLVDELGLDMDRVPPAIYKLLNHTKGKTEILPLSMSVKTIINQVLNSKFTGATQDVYIQSKLIELMCHTIERLYSTDNLFIQDTALPKMKVSALTQVIAVLNEQYRAPPSLNQLAKQVGLSRTNLCNSFKSACGLTISDYIRNRKMEISRALLTSGKYTILQVALEVSYQNQSSFGRTYRSYFNHSPKMDLPKR